MSGRARGRGVARGRGNPTAVQQTPTDPARRPGSSMPPQSLAGGEPTSNGGGSAGRASQRGGARGEPRPGVADLPNTQMAQTSMGTQDAPRRSRREVVYAEPNTRPAHITNKQGEVGTDSQLQVVVANYFKVTPVKDWILYQYHVDYNPPVDSRGLRKGLLKDHASRLFGDVSFLFDGMQLYSPLKLHDEVTEFVAEKRSDASKVRVIIKRVAELASNSPVVIQILNVHMRQNLYDLDMKEVQRSYFNPKLAIKLPAHRLEIWPGYKTSILQHEDDLLLNVDVSHKVLRTETVLDFMYGVFNRMGGNYGAFKDAIVRTLVGEIVMTRYNDKTYRVDDIEWDVRPANKFRRRDEEITYKDYYKSVYNIDVKDMDQPMLVSRPKKKDLRAGAPEMLYLLPELCNMTGLTDEMRANFTMMKDMGAHTRVDPLKRSTQLNKFMNSLKTNAEVQKRLKGWKLNYSDELVNVQGRIFRPEDVLLGPDGGSNTAKKVSAGPEADWGRAIRGRMFTAVDLRNWILIYFDRNEGPVSDFYQSLTRVAPPLGMRVAEPKRVKLMSSKTSDFLEAIKSHIDPSVQMVVCVLPSNKKDLYDAIKKQCCVETPVPSQCVTFNILKKPKGLMSVVTKIAIQLNCKLGGEAWAVPIPLPNTMVIGIDTYHDSAKKGRSVGGFVASLNKPFTRYFSQTLFQSNMQELIDGLTTCMTGALKKYKLVNQTLPDKVIIYRDGVGDGQLPAVFEHEMPQILKAFDSVGSGYKPEVTFVVVKKRINSRFFKKVPNGMANPGPGSVVDSVVTRPESYDFFLISQSVRQGTVTPTHYNVIYDTSSKLGPARIQRLTYKLTHLYYNWPGTIRVPAPCQYAHKLAFLIGQSVHRQPDLSLADKLYYL